MPPAARNVLHAVLPGRLPILRRMSTLERRIPWIIVTLAVLAGAGGYFASQQLFAPGASQPRSTRIQPPLPSSSGVITR